MYTCHQCGTVDREIDVRERAKGEDFVHWMKSATASVTQDHKAQSPWCWSDKVDLKIPLASNTAAIGEARRQ